MKWNLATYLTQSDADRGNTSGQRAHRDLWLSKICVGMYRKGRANGSTSVFTLDGLIFSAMKQVGPRGFQYGGYSWSLSWSGAASLGSVPQAHDYSWLPFHKFSSFHVRHHVFRPLLLSPRNSGTDTINPQDWTHVLYEVGPFSFLCVTQALNGVQMVWPFHADASFFSEPFLCSMCQCATIWGDRTSWLWLLFQLPVNFLLMHRTDECMLR